MEARIDALLEKVLADIEGSVPISGIEKNLWSDLVENLKSSFNFLNPTDDYTAQVIQLIEKLENGEEMGYEDLDLIQCAMQQLPFDQQPFMHRLGDFLLKNSAVVRTLSAVTTPLVGINLLGVKNGMLAKRMVGNLIDELLLCAPQTTDEKAQTGILETVLTGLFSPLAGIAVAADNLLGLASEDMNDAVVMGAYLSEKMGINFADTADSASSGLIFYLFYKDPLLFLKITNDLKEAQKALMEKPISENMQNVGYFVVDQVVKNLTELTNLLSSFNVNDKSDEAIIRIAAVAIGILIPLFNFWYMSLSISLPFTLMCMPFIISIFYLVNRRFEEKYKGLKTFQKCETTEYTFREYVLDQVNDEKINKVDKLKDILLIENVTAYNPVLDKAIQAVKDKVMSH